MWMLLGLKGLRYVGRVLAKTRHPFAETRHPFAETRHPFAETRHPFAGRDLTNSIVNLIKAPYIILLVYTQ